MGGGGEEISQKAIVRARFIPSLPPYTTTAFLITREGCGEERQRCMCVSEKREEEGDAEKNETQRTTRGRVWIQKDIGVAPPPIHSGNGYERNGGVG